MPKFLAEIEEIEIVRTNLLKKDLILADETFYTKLDYREFFKQAFKIDKSVCSLEIVNLYKEILKKVDNSDLNGNGITSVDVNNSINFAQYLIFVVYSDDVYPVYSIISSLDRPLRDEFIIQCLCVLKILLSFQIANEIDFSRRLGLVLGKMTLAQNRMITLDKFDFKNFLISSIECRRILVGVTFISHFLRQGKDGLVFIPNNPWLISIMNLLAELHSCTLRPVRREIESIFGHFNLRLEPKVIKSFKFKTKDYLSEYHFESSEVIDPIMKHVISLALDFSVREISEIIIEKSCEIATKTGIGLFKTVIMEKGNEYVIFRNLLINLTKALCYMSAQEPMRACMTGNISYFLKLSALELSPDQIYKVVSTNQPLCCQLIQRAGVSKVADCISDYFKNTEMNTGKYSEINLSLLENTTHIEKFSIKPIEPSEYQDLKSHFLQISRRRASENTNFVGEEWYHLLGSNAKDEFKRIKSRILLCDDVDGECIKLCKYITGHLIKNMDNYNKKKENDNTTNSPIKLKLPHLHPPNKNTIDFLFKCLSEIFNISFKTQKEVLGWLIYSNDPRRFSVNFVSKFIEHRLMNIVEYDQALSRSISPETNLDFVLNLLGNLMTSDIQICTVYDFIATLEALANFSEDSRVYDFFQKISRLMMSFDNADTTEFDNLIKSEKYNIFTSDLMLNRLSKFNMSIVNLRGAFKSSWEHFIRHHKVPTQYCYYKIDMVPLLITTKASIYIKTTLEIFLDAYARRNYLFLKFYTRFLKKLFDVLEDTPENKGMIQELLILLSPSTVPFFTTGYLDLILHKFVQNISIDYILKISLDILGILRHSEAYIYPVTIYFENLMQNKSFMKVYGIYLSYLCPYKFVNLKNIFNQYRDNVQFVEDQNDYFKIRRMLQSNMQSIKEYFNEPYFVFYLLDNLNEKNIVSVYAFNVLRVLINEKRDIKKIIFLFWAYSEIEHTPEALTLYFEELKGYEWAGKIIESFESKFNK
ncbi:NOT1-like general negative regulator of transcription subunit 1 [Nosema bombycis CQ1]|uniref:NOT1-like general negative regulator of transcription subunit 1 n=1 Tax=Nosema bombycis (strain CQ1 / CVCC 102059) TaxID=578461 RepID=R0MH38_NOSB1|nr:NOT1-like general negative regulator of transcription subunit 1 [Nosema bombycis CQ1]|eukprot:EOB12108.1 NOT1-like general negative regulator of transcription subunit 1 [Nosema bombycis CQ1]